MFVFYESEESCHMWKGNGKVSHLLFFLKTPSDVMF